MRRLIFALLLSRCAPIVSTPQASTQPFFVQMVAGEPAYTDGWFLSDDSARGYLKEKSNEQLDQQKELERTRLRLSADDKALSRQNWLAEWGLPLGGMCGFAIGALVIGLIEISSHH